MHWRLLFLSLVSILLVVSSCATTRHNHRQAKKLNSWENKKYSWSEAFNVDETHLIKLAGPDKGLIDLFVMDKIVAWNRVTTSNRNEAADIWTGSLTILHQPTGFAISFPVYETECAKEADEGGGWHRTMEADYYCRPANYNLRGEILYSFYQLQDETLARLFADMVAGENSPEEIAEQFAANTGSIVGLELADSKPPIKAAWKAYRNTNGHDKAVLDRWNEIGIYKPAIFAKFGSGSYNGALNKQVRHMLGILSDQRNVRYITQSYKVSADF